MNPCKTRITNGSSGVHPIFVEIWARICLKSQNAPYEDGEKFPRYLRADDFAGKSLKCGFGPQAFFLEWYMHKRKREIPFRSDQEVRTGASAKGGDDK